jgi:hypothetical protein
MLKNALLKTHFAQTRVLAGSSFGWQQFWLAAVLVGSSFGWQQFWLTAVLAGIFCHQRMIFDPIHSGALRPRFDFKSLKKR